ncbi:ParB/RepB/Spo0J family partition protein (plasmid) [Euhalothece natronophila Z-M001]|uniref:ParB/RepB/Spo0J family partition protein n=1 Tax=Euhalothece natronophila Z-M001 TaxID=522448 RepID=A0A5B8NR69_9CHRO|nr:ParB/RepB/Spo0J family partition protein [Euhalothece natronophila]QDZ41584.1 ParB/RepB/Spo0J family partition protein [Euhalothece natronophila Z-M001]
MAKRRNVQSFLAELPKEAESDLLVSAIVPSQLQPRRYFDDEKLEQLTGSIKKHGILEPLLVRPLQKGNHQYELVAGERRFRAAQALRLETVPVIIRDLTDEEALALSLVENLAREDLNAVEETEGVIALLGIELNLDHSEVVSLLYQLDNHKKGKVTHNVMGKETVEQVEAIFEGLGYSFSSFIANRLPLLNLPQEILDVLRSGKLAYTKATAIARVKDEASRQQLLAEAVEENLSLNEIKERVKAIKSSKTEKVTPVQKIDRTVKQLKSSQLWKSDPEKWKRVESLLAEMESLISQE